MTGWVGFVLGVGLLVRLDCFAPLAMTWSGFFQGDTSLCLCGERSLWCASAPQERRRPSALCFECWGALREDVVDYVSVDVG